MSSLSATEAGKQPQGSVQSPTVLLLKLSFQTLGIIYSDIGTSPLYTMNGLWPASGDVPSEEDIIGGVSAIIWALTILPLLKYICISLRFGTSEGEGGVFALYQGLYPPPRHTTNNDFIVGDVKEKMSPDTESIVTTSSSTPTISEKFRWPLLIWALFGTSLTLADGIFTPAVSVTSAVSGIAVAKPSVAADVIPISVALLIVLFLAQFCGTSRLGFTFAPATFGWISLLAATGIVNIISHPAIFRAIDPSRAILLFVRTKNYDILAGVLLAITGCEAMFACLGHFNALSIQLSFGCFVYPSLILAYLGQGAKLISDGEHVLQNIFYNSIPGPTGGPLYWIMFVFGILATFIASQTLITASFSLIQQLIKLHVLPPLRINFTSDYVQGQVYIPVVNWILMVITIIIVATFKDPAKLSNAYGFSVATVMFCTTFMLAIQMKYVKHLPIFIPVVFFVLFGFFDALFWGAALKKIPLGAWLPLAIGGILMVIMVFWSWAKGLEDEFDGANRRDLHRVILRQESQYNSGVNTPEEIRNTDDDTEFDEKYFIQGKDSALESLLLEGARANLELARLPTFAIFHKLTAGKGVPHSFTGFMRQWPALPRVVVFLSVEVLNIARIPIEEQYIVDKIPNIKGFYSATYRLGYRQNFDMNANTLLELICRLEARNDPQSSGPIIQEIRAAAQRTTHMVPHYVVASKQIGSGRTGVAITWCRRFLIEELYRRFATMFPETATWLGSADEIIHVGVTAEI